MANPRNLRMFPGCPACGSDFGSPPAGRPPSLRLDLGGGSPGKKSWRLSLFTETGGLGRFWASPSFVAADTETVYWLCGDGHLYFDHRVLTSGRRATTGLIEDHDRAAMVGSIAAGKSYLLLRTLSQHLTLPPDARTSATQPIRKLVGDPVEERPMTILKTEYQKAAEQGIPLSQTNLQEMMPVPFLAGTVGQDLVDQIHRIHAELNPTAEPDPNWGNRVRQPIVQRYDAAGKRVFTSVADLPGEFYNTATSNSNRSSVLRGYSSLLWVVDPIVVPEFRDFLPDDVRDLVTVSSMRPDAPIQADLRKARIRRAAQQREIANRLANDEDGISGNVGKTQQVLVCFTKADLVALATQHGRPLSELGKHDTVVEGVANYLIHVATRASASGQDGGDYVEPLVWDSVIGELSGARHERANRNAMARHIARAMVGHYSDGERLWNLVHDGDEDLIDVPTGERDIETSGKISVPSLEQHVAAAMTRTQAGVLRQRDLVMSALACGLVVGLDLTGAVHDLLDQHWRDVRFFLCSPFGKVPVITPGSADHFEPMDGTDFPALDSRSAALVQLHLSLLTGVRP